MRITFVFSLLQVNLSHAVHVAAMEFPADEVRRSHSRGSEAQLKGEADPPLRKTNWLGKEYPVWPSTSTSGVPGYQAGSLVPSGRLRADCALCQLPVGAPPGSYRTRASASLQNPQH